MSPRPATTEPDHPADHAQADHTPADHTQADALYYRDVLHQLIDMGLDLARQLHQQATTQAPAPDATPAPDPAFAFDRIARAIRRTVALARSLAEPPAAEHAAPGTATHRILARKRVIREVEDAIQRTRDGRESDLLHTELRERLDSPDLDDEIANRPLADIIADICRDLGLAAPPDISPWKRRTPADLIELRALAAEPPAQPPPAAPPRQIHPTPLYPLRV